MELKMKNEKILLPRNKTTELIIVMKLGSKKIYSDFNFQDQ